MPGRWPSLLLVLGLSLACLLRVLGPSDLDGKDQPKTVSYTVDILEHGRWVLPYDMLGQPSSKPPLYNWLSVPAIRATGLYTEFLFKLPALLAAIGVTLLVWWAARTMAGPTAAALAALFWLANVSTYRLLYVARPDMLLAGFLLAAWWAGHRALEAGDAAPFRLRLALWLCVAAAALTKGPPALLPVVYLLVAARLLHGGFRRVAGTGIAWGLPLAILLFVVWAVPAARLSPPEHTEWLQGVERERLFGRPLDHLVSPFRAVGWFLGRSAPWSLLFVAALWGRGKRAWHRRGAVESAAILWTLLVLALAVLPARTRDDYLLPAYPTAAIAGAAWLVRAGDGTRRRRRIVAAAVAALLILAGSGVNDFLFKSQLRDRYGDNVRRFAREVEEVVASTSDVVFVDCGYNPLQALLGRNQAAPRPDAGALAKRSWRIAPFEPGRDAVVVSDPIPHVLGYNRPARLGLYRTR